MKLTTKAIARMAGYRAIQCRNGKWIYGEPGVVGKWETGIYDFEKDAYDACVREEGLVF